MKKIKTLLTCVFAGLFLVCVSRANIFSDFKDFLQSQYMKPFARDIGGLIGSSDFHDGKVAGFPGFDITVYGNLQMEPETDNEILNLADVDIFGVPMIAATVGLPFNFEVTARGMGYAGATLIGGGVKYGLFQGKAMGLLPNIKVGAYYDIFDHEYLKIKHWSVFASASLNLPMMTPYAGIAMDQTELETKISAGGVAIGTTVTVTEPRFTAGVNVTVFPMIYVFGAYTWLHGNTGFQGGAGISF